MTIVGAFTTSTARNPLIALKGVKPPLQATWYEIAAGRAYLAARKPGLALKRFLAIRSHYELFYEDHYDFHNYCMRRLTLRAYLDSLALQTHLFGQPDFIKGAIGAVRTYF